MCSPSTTGCRADLLHACHNFGFTDVKCNDDAEKSGSNEPQGVRLSHVMSNVLV